MLEPKHERVVSLRAGVADLESQILAVNLRLGRWPHRRGQAGEGESAMVSTALV